jgi:hypothetical protein
MTTGYPGGYFNDQLGFRQWHEFSKRAMRRPTPADDTAFARLGFEKLRLLSDLQARRILDHVRGQEAQPANLFRPDPYLQHVVLSKKDFARVVLASLLGPEVDRRITAFFGSEYLIKWFTVVRASPHPVSESSFRWHVDGGPTAHAKILLYLTGTGEHGGRTDFVDIENSGKIFATGYHLRDVGNREEDLGPLAAKVGAPWPPAPFRIEVGEAALFKPNAVLHRGVLPTANARYTIQVCLLPSPVPWRQHFERHPVREFQTLDAINWELGFPEELAARNRGAPAAATY